MAAVKLLLNRGAGLVLNKSYTSFLHEALQNGRKDVVNAVIDSDKWARFSGPASVRPLSSCNSLSSPRCTEALTLFETNTPQRCPIVDMIEFLPDTYKVDTNPHICHRLSARAERFPSDRTLTVSSAFFTSICWTAV